MPTQDQTPGAKLGKWMLMITWLLILVGLTFVFGLWEKHQYNPNQNLTLNTGAEVVLQRNRFNHYVATGLINDQPVVFMLDTGATNVSVPAGLARRLGLRPGMALNAMTANGIVEVYATRLDSLQLGSIRLANVSASINPGMSGDEVLLGMSALKDLEFTQSGATLTLRQLPYSQ
jgi:aspartyl protease family protein